MSGRADFAQQLQALARRVAADEQLSLQDAADQLDTMCQQLRKHLADVGAATVPSTTPSPATTTVVATKTPTASTGAAVSPSERAPGGHGSDGDGRGGSGVVGGTSGGGAEAKGPPDEGPGEDEEGEEGAAGMGAQPAKKQRRAPREFDFSRYRTRHVALELMYVGWSFQGFARQENTENTIEGALFTALRRVKLIPESSVVPISDLQYSRCGRTDRGVSALGQVVALRLRSSARVDEPEAPLDREYDYPRLINKALPVEIRILGWDAVPDDFNARFSAQYREYKYFIVQQWQPSEAPTPPRTTSLTRPGPTSNSDPNTEPAEADAAPSAVRDPSTSAAPAPSPQQPPRMVPSLDIDAMREAAGLFVGEHDFRNFCKADVTAVRSFRRRILSFTIDPVPTAAGGPPVPGREEPRRGRGREEEGRRGEGEHQVYALTVRGTAFLWHQVRCLAAVLLMVGRGQERPSVVADLLDVGAVPRKPQYSMAPEEPLLLYACGFGPGLSFRRSGPSLAANLADVAGLVHRQLIGAALTAACYGRLAGDERLPQTAGAGGGKVGGGCRGGGAPGHIPLLRRQTEPSIEERMARRGISWPSEATADGGEAGAAADDPMVE